MKASQCLAHAWLRSRVCASMYLWTQPCQHSAKLHSLAAHRHAWRPRRSLLKCLDGQAGNPVQAQLQAMHTDVPGVPEHLLIAWRQLYQDLLQVVQRQHAPNKRARMAALRAAMQDIMDQLAPEAAQQLEQQLIDGRIAARKLEEARLAAAFASGPQVVVDCSFAEEHCRPGLEKRSLAKQVEWAMAVNRKATAPLGLHATSWAGEVQQFGEHLGSRGWPVKLHSQHLTQVFDMSRVVVMSPDAPQPLLELDPHAVYVVGGIVDRTVKKGVTATYAEEQGLQCRRLPIAEYAAELGLDQPGVRTSPVLNVSDVVIALVDFNHTGNWASALDRAIPARKRRPQQVKPKKYRSSWTSTDSSMSGTGPD